MSKYLKMLSVAGLACLPGISMADGASSPLGKILADSGVSVGGHLSASYQTGFNDGNALAGRAFDGKTDSFTFNQAQFNIAMQPASGFGGVVNVLVGDDAAAVNGAYGDGSGKFNLLQGFVQYASGPLTVMAGRYVTLAGYEVIDDSATPFISRSWLFQNAEPLVHTGVRASYKLSDTITGYLGVNNATYDGVSSDSNKQKTIESGIALAPSSALSIGLYDYYGVDSDTARNYADVVVNYAATDKLTLALNGDYYRQFSKGAVPGLEVKGVALYGLYQVSSLVGVRGRFEYVKDGMNNAGGSKANNIETITGDLVLSPAKNFDLIGEVRYDLSKKSEKIFPNGAGVKDHQGDVAIKAVYKF